MKFSAFAYIELVKALSNERIYTLCNAPGTTIHKG